MNLSAEIAQERVRDLLRQAQAARLAAEAKRGAPVAITGTARIIRLPADAAPAQPGHAMPAQPSLATPAQPDTQVPVRSDTVVAGRAS